MNGAIFIKYLCQCLVPTLRPGEIVIINTTPDKSVGEVIENTRNGVIQKGDNVTTKL